MEKRGQISGAKKPNAAPRADVDRVIRRAKDLGFDVHQATEAAGLGRATGFRFVKYEASVASLRTLEDWVVTEEGRQRKLPAATKEQLDDGLRELAALGEELQRIDPSRFATTLEAVRDVVESVRLQQRAILKMFRATPDHDR